MDWFLALRCAKLNALKAVKPNLQEHEVKIIVRACKNILLAEWVCIYTKLMPFYLQLLYLLTWDFTKAGYLCKMPPSQKVRLLSTTSCHLHI